jgi:bacteriocin-type transport-associated protein
MRKVLYILGLLTDEDVDWLAAAGARQAVAAGTTLIREGSVIASLFMVLEGQMRVTVSRPQPRVLGLLGPGEILGEISFVDARPASATVTAATPAQVLNIPREAVSARLKSDVAFAARFYQAIAVLLAHRLRKQTTATLGFGDARDLDEQVEAPDELSPEFLDDLALAGARSDWILKRLRGR